MGSGGARSIMRVEVATGSCHEQKSSSCPHQSKIKFASSDIIQLNPGLPKFEVKGAKGIHTDYRNHVGRKVHAWTQSSEINKHVLIKATWNAHVVSLMLISQLQAAQQTVKKLGLLGFEARPGFLELYIACRPCWFGGSGHALSRHDLWPFTMPPPLAWQRPSTLINEVEGNVGYSEERLSVGGFAPPTQLWWGCSGCVPFGCIYYWHYLWTSSGGLSKFLGEWVSLMVLLWVCSGPASGP